MLLINIFVMPLLLLVSLCNFEAVESLCEFKIVNF